MAWARRRPTGGYGGSRFETASKTDFETVAAEAGGYTVTRENVGEWNECRVFRVADKVVGTVMKGSRPNWQHMVEDTTGKPWGQQ